MWANGDDGDEEDDSFGENAAENRFYGQQWVIMTPPHISPVCTATTIMLGVGDFPSLLS